MKTDTSRRALLKGAPVAALAIALPAAAAPIADRREWEAGLRKLAAVEAEADDFTPGYMDLWDRCRAECEAIPHIDCGFSKHMGRSLSTSDDWLVRRVRKDCDDLAAGKMRFEPWPELDEHKRQMAELVKAADERDTERAAIRARYDMDTLDGHSEELTDRIVEALDALMEMPSPDLAALAWKLGKLRDGDGDMSAWSADYVRQTFIDIARLLPEAK